MKSIDDTDNFDEFPDVELKFSKLAKSLMKLQFHVSTIFAEPSSNTGSSTPYKDWMFMNYTFKRFEGLTQRGKITAKQALKTTLR